MKLDRGYLYHYLSQITLQREEFESSIQVIETKVSKISIAQTSIFSHGFFATFNYFIRCFQKQNCV